VFLLGGPLVKKHAPNKYLCDELSKMKIEVIPSGTLSHISIEPTLQDQIVMAQLSDKGMRIFIRRWKSIRVFAKTARGYCGLR
jgi:hypothetical protein